MYIKIHGSIKINNWQILKRKTHDLNFTLFLKDFLPDAYSEPSRTYKMELFGDEHAEIVNS